MSTKLITFFCDHVIKPTDKRQVSHDLLGGGNEYTFRRGLECITRV